MAGFFDWILLFFTKLVYELKTVSEEKKPEIEFPCKYPIKVLGDAHPDLNQHQL